MYDLAALERVCKGKLHYLPVTGSTNSDALDAARNGAPHGSVFLTDEQTAGRGRGGHLWHSTQGSGLYVSVLLRPRLDLASLPLLPLAAGLAAVVAIGEVTGKVADLRWPNDLLLGPRKAGGILVEAKTETNRIAYAVVGVGINVHQREFAPDLATPATSLDLEAGRSISRQDLLVALLESLENESRGLEEPSSAFSIPERVALTSTWVRGRRVAVHGPQACLGVTEGLDEQGFLLVRTATGLTQVQTGGIRDATEIS